MPLRLAAVLAATWLLSGCMRPAAPELSYPVPAQWAHGGAVAGHKRRDTGLWWQRQGGPDLARLVVTALADSPRLDQAVARVVAARALARAEGSRLFPQLDGLAGATLRARPVGSPDGLNEGGEDRGRGPRRAVAEGQAGFDASWEIDLFGRTRQAIRAAEANAAMAEEEASAARVTLIAEVVRTYVELRAAETRKAIILRETDARRELAEMTRRRREAGISGAQDVERALAAAESAAARIPLSDLAIDTARQRLATLLGQPAADPAFAGSARVPVLDPPAPMLPLDLVRTRPEIRLAEWTALQRAAELGVAVADLYPRLTLGGSVTLAVNLLGQPLSGNALQVEGGPALRIPLFDWGQRRAVVDAREAGLQEALAAYREAVLKGVEEVELALAGYKSARRRAARLEAALVAADRALAMSDRLFRNGLASLDERLTAETEARGAELALVDAREAAALAAVALYKALGGPDISALSPPVVATGASAAMSPRPAPRTLGLRGTH